MFYKKLDGIRAFAVIMVMISHWIHLKFIQRLELGFLGVNIFFVLSGFLITEILLKQLYLKENIFFILKSFYLKRVLRIFPVYYFVIFVSLIFNFDNIQQLWIYYISYSINIYNSFTGFIGNHLSHVWSLCVEEQFYIVWPIVLILVNSRHYLFLMLMIILFSLLFRYYFVYKNMDNYQIFNYRMMPACLDSLGFGALLAFLKLNHEKYLILLLSKWILPLLALFIYIFLLFSSHVNTFLNEIGLRFLVALFSFYLIGRAVYFMSARPWMLLENKFVLYLGKISYGMYLYHLIISNVLHSKIQEILNNYEHFIPIAIKFNPYLVTFPIYFIVTLTISSISYQLIEQPFLRIKDKFKLMWINN